MRAIFAGPPSTLSFPPIGEAQPPLWQELPIMEEKAIVAVLSRFDAAAPPPRQEDDCDEDLAGSMVL